MLIQFAISLIGICLFTNPVIRANPVGASQVGCSHDGRAYNVGETIVIDCDNCVCEPGLIVCPKEPSCPRKCFFKGNHHQNGDSWTDNGTCDTCSCNDGTVVCINKDCSSSCTVNGRHYDVGEIYVKNCEKCECLGYNKVKCDHNFCPCIIGNEIVQHGEDYTDVTDVRGTLVYICTDGRIREMSDNRHG